MNLTSLIPYFYLVLKTVNVGNLGKDKSFLLFYEYQRLCIYRESIQVTLEQQGFSPYKVQHVL
jgi:hypothetical protein